MKVFEKDDLIVYYPGKHISFDAFETKWRRYQERTGETEKETRRKFSEYAMELEPPSSDDEDHSEGGVLLDPTDDDGEIIAEYKDNVGLYVNEPPRLQAANCGIWPVNSDLGVVTKIGMYATKRIERGAEITINYGQ